MSFFTLMNLRSTELSDMTLIFIEVAFSKRFKISISSRVMLKGYRTTYLPLSSVESSLRMIYSVSSISFYSLIAIGILRFLTVVAFKFSRLKYIYDVS